MFIHSSSVWELQMFLTFLLVVNKRVTLDCMIWLKGNFPMD